MISKRNYKAALGFVNKMRKKKGKDPLDKLPEGCGRSLHSCPIAEAIGDCRVNNTRVTEIGPYGEEITPLPRDVARFVKQFDKSTKDRYGSVDPLEYVR